ncbi:hypothetical protein NHH03_27585 [Stieleria sp. TO1_6]|uniref:hypothetical protein n=1 Tax=Stieleria tagensis TaxID=2956795 RepID=UPI00209B4FC3|nr:hypothetical protein [Stieleria tagensis]MCO8125532.1 hypothetical protein [Stieleria tagensis]
MSDRNQPSKAGGIDHFFNRHRMQHPNWRWISANQRAMGKLGVRHNDAMVQQLRECLFGRSSEIRVVPTGHGIGLKEITSIYNSPVQRLCVEARVLAYREIEIAATAAGLPRETMRAYCEVFFDVSDWIDAKAAIQNHIVRRTDQPSFPLREKLYQFAYAGGPTVAEHWISHLPHLGAGIAHDLSTIEGIERERIELHISSIDRFHLPGNAKFHDTYQRVVEETPRHTGFSDLISDHAASALCAHLGDDDLRSQPMESSMQQLTVKRTLVTKPRQAA